jgi:thiosulfate/3-mercaptopyruvate sulfurtransferase
MTAHYPNPGILTDTAWLAGRLDGPGLRVVDCDEYPAYQRMHIPGAIGLRVHHYLKGGDGVHVMPPGRFEEVMSAHGVSNDTLVVAYDNSGGLYAARLWWTLDYYGHTNCKLLNGGFRSWWQEGRPVAQDQPKVRRARFKAGPPAPTICGLDEMKAAIERDDAVIWDVRAPAEYTGEDPRQNRRGGHIPGAVNLEWLEMTAPPARSGLLLPADEIRRKLEAAGITPDKTVLTH